MVEVECSSHGFKYMKCPVDGVIIGLNVKKQLSSTDCKKDSTFGYDKGDVWVNKGCRAIFTLKMSEEEAEGIY